MGRGRRWIWLCTIGSAKRPIFPSGACSAFDRKNIQPTSVTVGIFPAAEVGEITKEILSRTKARILKVKLGSDDGIEADKAMFAAAQEAVKVRRIRPRMARGRQRRLECRRGAGNDAMAGESRRRIHRTTVARRTGERTSPLCSVTARCRFSPMKAFMSPPTFPKSLTAWTASTSN